MRRLFGFLALLGLSGCAGDGDDDTSNDGERSEAQRLCNEWCALVDDAMCANADSECFAGCMHNAVPCLPEARAFLDCVPNVVCNQDGRPTTTNCQGPFMAFGDCAPG